MVSERTKQWWRMHLWRVLRAVAFSLAVVWTFNVSCGGISVLSPARFAVSITCGMIVWDEDCIGQPGLRLEWCPASYLDDMGPPAPFLPFSRPQPLVARMPTRGSSVGVPFLPVVIACGAWAWIAWRKQRRSGELASPWTTSSWWDDVKSGAEFRRKPKLPGGPCVKCGCYVAAGARCVECGKSRR